ncbi:MAG: hypothetical protein RSD55_05815 [Lachnospiraceae bacterium]
MDGLEDRKQIIISRKIIPTCIFFLLLLTRGLIFYERRGVSEIAGWGTFEFHKGILVAVILLFCVGIWIKFNCFFNRVFLPSAAMGIMLVCDEIYRRHNDLKWAYGLWLSLFISVTLLLYCLFIYYKKPK